MNQIDELDRSRSKIPGCRARETVMMLSPRARQDCLRDFEADLVIRADADFTGSGRAA
jgi:hypothetical protein